MINKVIYGKTTLLDLTADTVTPEHLEQGYTAHNSDGEAITGTLSPGMEAAHQLTFSPMEQACTNIASIAYAEVLNDAGGKTFILGGVNSGL